MKSVKPTVIQAKSAIDAMRQLMAEGTKRLSAINQEVKRSNSYNAIGKKLGI